MNINPVAAGDKLLEHFVDIVKCPICKVNTSRMSLDGHIRQELSDDHVEGEILEQKLWEMEYDKI